MQSGLPPVSADMVKASISPHILSYCIFFLILNTSVFMFSNKRLVYVVVGIQEMLVRTANSADPDQTASEEAVWSGSALLALVFFFCWQLVYEIFKHLQ